MTTFPSASILQSRSSRGLPVPKLILAAAVPVLAAFTGWSTTGQHNGVLRHSSPDAATPITCAASSNTCVPTRLRRPT
jgi:hypothetical protein